MHRPSPQPVTLGVTASMEALDKLLREGRPEFAASGGTAVWTPHRPPRPEKSEGGVRLELKSELEPKGDQPTAIKDLVEGVKRHDRTQVLLGVTGSGKTFTMAKVIEATQRPALILAPNKTLAAQLYGEFKSFFPDNAVEYFVSYYDYYQPEAYVPRTDTYIEKDSSINEQIDRMRHSATRALLERDDVIIVASVSCIYGIGSVETYSAMTFTLKKGERIDQRQLLADLVALQYKRNDGDFARGTFRVRGDTIEIFPAHYEDRAWRINLFGDEVESITEFDPLTGQKTDELEFVKIYANSHYVTPRPTLNQAIAEHQGRAEVAARRAERHRPAAGGAAARAAHPLRPGDDGGDRLLRRHRELFALSHRPQARRAAADAVRIRARQRAGVRRREPRHRAADRRHVPRRLPPQGDARRIRLPPALVHGQPAAALRGMGRDAAADRRRLGDARRRGRWNEAGGVFAEQVIRPTGLIDPPVEVRPARTQVDDLVGEVREVARQGYRALVTVLTKRMAEDLTEYLHEQGIRVRYMHSDIDTLERIEIIRDLRLGAFDALVGINLLREGLDIPECALVAILDADKEGFLRSETSLIQTIGRAARNVDGRVILYADQITGSMERAMAETNRRREKQTAYNDGQRHHAGERQEIDRRHHGQRLRARPRAGLDRRGRRRRRRGRRHHRPQLRGGARRPRDAHARRRRRPRVRGGRAAARRDQAAARHRARGGRRSDREGRQAAGRRARTCHARTSRISTRWASRTYHEVAPARSGKRDRRASPRSTRWARARRASPIGRARRPARARPPASPACTAAGSRARVAFPIHMRVP